MNCMSVCPSQKTCIFIHMHVICVRIDLFKHKVFTSTFPPLFLIRKTKTETFCFVYSANVYRVIPELFCMCRRHQLEKGPREFNQQLRFQAALLTTHWVDLSDPSNKTRGKIRVRPHRTTWISAWVWSIIDKICLHGNRHGQQTSLCTKNINYICTIVNKLHFVVINQEILSCEDSALCRVLTRLHCPLSVSATPKSPPARY